LIPNAGERGSRDSGRNVADEPSAMMVSVPVPRAVLMAAIVDAMVV
jgi:hypothetical protein